MIPPPPPLPVEDLPAGHVLHVGRYVSTVMPDFDFETYSEAGFVWSHAKQKWAKIANASTKKSLGNGVGRMNYTCHPTAEILCLAYNLKDGKGRRRWYPGQPAPTDLYAHVAAGKPIAAWNAGFEFGFWEFVMVPHHGAPLLKLEQLHCDMAKARAYALPPALDEASKVLKLPGKDKEGKRLIDKLTVPRSPTQKDKRLRFTRTDEPTEFAKFDDYNERDIVAEAQASALVPDLTPDERTYWLTDQRINRRGIAVDVEGLHACIEIIEQAHQQYNAELYQLTEGAVDKASKIQRLKKWLTEHGVTMKSLKEEAVIERLKSFPPLPPKLRRALEIRALVGSASVKKVFAMRNQMSPEGRLHDLYVFHGARTGRPTGYGPQPTNLPNSAGVYVYRCDDCSHHFSTHRTACPWCGSAV